jgi:hypothetical protein
MWRRVQGNQQRSERLMKIFVAPNFILTLSTVSQSVRHTYTNSQSVSQRKKRQKPKTFFKYLKVRLKKNFTCSLTTTHRMSEIRRKLVIVGDGTCPLAASTVGACGKTCLLIVFSRGTFPEVHPFFARIVRFMFQLCLRITLLKLKWMGNVWNWRYGIQPVTS